MKYLIAIVLSSMTHAQISGTLRVKDNVEVPTSHTVSLSSIEASSAHTSDNTLTTDVIPQTIVLYCNNEPYHDACSDATGWVPCAKDMALSIATGAIIGSLTGIGSHYIEKSQVNILCSWPAAAITRVGLIEGVDRTFNRYAIKHSRQLMEHTAFAFAWLSYFLSGSVWPQQFRI